MIVGNTETVYDGSDFENTEEVFALNVASSKDGYGRAAHKQVTLMRGRDEEPIDTYYPPHFFERQL